jgi:hypothetical protein
VVRTLHNSLKKYSLFRKCLKILAEDIIYILKNSEQEEEQENVYELVRGVIPHVKEANPHPQIDRSSWESLRTAFCSLNEKQLEQAIEIVTSFLLENPSVMHHILYRLSKSPKV